MQPHETDITEQTKHIINSGGVSYDLFWKEYKHKISAYTSIQHTDRNSYYGAQKNKECLRQDERPDLGLPACGGQYGQLLLCPATFTGGLNIRNNSLHDIKDRLSS